MADAGWTVDSEEVAPSQGDDDLGTATLTFSRDGATVESNWTHDSRTLGMTLGVDW